MQTVFKLIFLIMALVGIAPRGFGQISIINLGTSRNAYSNAFGLRQNIVASNASNSVALVHRHTLPGSTGTIKADVSIDGGNTWVVNKIETWNGASTTSSARYPRAALINPTGNTNGSNAVLVSAQPVLDGSNGGAWGGLGISGFTLDGTSLGNQAFSSSTGGFMHQIPSSVVSAGNKVFILDKNGDLASTTFSDTLLLTTGTFNGSSFQWNTQFFNFPTGTGSNGKAGITDMTMAFDPTGQIGYIVALTHIDFVSDTASNYLPVLMKTTDGGNTWSSPVQLNIGAAVNSVLNLGTSITVGTGFEISATVDYLGNCHFITHVGEVNGVYSIITSPGKSGTFHFSSNGSTLLSCTQIGAPSSLRGTFGTGSSTLSQDTRPCASRNEAGTALFFSWFETDINNSTANDQPDLLSVGYTVSTQLHTPGRNITKNTLAEGAMVFGSVAPIVFERIGTNGKPEFELPVSFVELNASGDVTDSCYHRYLKGATMGNLTVISFAANGITAVCDGTPVVLNSNGLINMQWYRNGQVLTGDTSQTYLATVAGSYFLVSNGDTSNTITITTASRPIISLPDTLRSSNLSVLLSPGAAQTYQWSTGDTSSTLIVTNSGQYRIVASNALGCSSSDTCVVIFNQSAPSPLPTQTAALNYQASLSNSQGQPLANSTVNVRFSVYDSVSTTFSETQTVTTDARGHFSTRIGQGTTLVGSLGAISWWDGKPRNLKTEVDLNNSGNWTNLGNSPLVMVPYSMYSLRSDDGRRSLFGSIDASGNILTGRGFTVTNLGNNQFEINFLKPFSEIPNVILEPVGSSPSLNLLSRNLHKFVAQFTGSELQFEVKGY